ncbi:TPA: hypothetical protein N0F65_011174 [Lagenidium giganteum]|uniref:Uncharacterized protein n=1 Tax=Lagenidium giganteum TaxID=4803 RepID=A0AAV2YXM0_9STRA|nr:TPA: hypothetical protein N0F65_007037 [Lagenidium giganteum]DBA02107.1 TPA: hypothetical protein N0F65_011174 [Lagenidium giganteum]
MRADGGSDMTQTSLYHSGHPLAARRQGLPCSSTRMRE